MPACQQNLNATKRRDVAYAPDQRMKLDSSAEVVVLLADADVPLPKGVLPAHTSTTVSGVVTQCVVNATLSGNDFQISPGGPQERSFIGGNTYVSWSWTVTPLKTGRLSLRLEIDPIYVAQIGSATDNVVDQPSVYSKFITVVATGSSPVAVAWRGVSGPVGLAVIGAVITALVSVWVTATTDRRREARAARRSSGPGPAA